MAQLLFAHGDVKYPLPETVRVLDEVVTEFVQGTAFEAARAAHHSGRQKIKFEDFQFAFRKNPRFLGKVQEVFEKKGEIESARKAFNQDDDVVTRDAAADELAAAIYPSQIRANAATITAAAANAAGFSDDQDLSLPLSASTPGRSGSQSAGGGVPMPLALPVPRPSTGAAGIKRSATDAGLGGRDDEELGEADDDAEAEEDALGRRR